MKTYLIFLALILLSLTACKKDKHINGTGTPPPQQQLPPITTEGKNTFGCLVNGEIWLPEITPYQMFQYPLVSSYENNGFYLRANKKINDEIFQSVEIIINNFYSEQLYYLNSNSLFENMGGFSDVKKNCLYITDSTQVGTVEILKLDIPNKIIAGTFEMKLWKNGCDTVNITDGRFDVKFAQ
jgi:hypothetical protein